MKLPLSWLKEYVELTLPAKELAQRLTMAGLESALVEGGSVLEVEVTPNRPDWLSVLGVAREVAALSGQHVREPLVDYAEAGVPIGEVVAIDIADPDLCHRYSASLITGVRVGPSPQWMQERLEAAGVRPINNVVDVTNYVMLEYGQPLHAFDFDRIRCHRVIIRRAREGERLVTLDGVARALGPETLVIADGEGPLAIAGVMGGEDSEVGAGTTSVLLESANFYNFSIRRTSWSLGMRTEASIRFEKGISPELTVPALRRATRLILELAGGQAAQGIADVYPVQARREVIDLSQDDLRRILGVDWSLDRARQALSSLGFEVQGAGNGLRVVPPVHRSDVSLTEDVVEEVARIIGYEAIPVTNLRGQPPPPQRDPIRDLEERARDLLVGCGLQEVITYALTGRLALEKAEVGEMAAINLANPMSREQECLRPTLRPGLLMAVATNQRYGEEGAWLFEVGKVFWPREGDLPQERRMVAGALYGLRGERSWLSHPRDVDFFDAKGLVEALLGGLGLSGSFQPRQEPFFISGRAATLLVGDTPVGNLGEVHPKVREAFKLLPKSVCTFEIDLEGLLPYTQALRRFQEIPRYPGLYQDLSIVVDVEVSAAQVQAIIESFPLVRRAVLFDVYTGENLPPGKRSLTYSLLYHSPDRTLTDKEAQEVHRQIVERLAAELGATLRGQPAT
jgi:phenylalanyl-tRNA synthetase beta chain